MNLDVEIRWIKETVHAVTTIPIVHTRRFEVDFFYSIKFIDPAADLRLIYEMFKTARTRLRGAGIRSRFSREQFSSRAVNSNHLIAVYIVFPYTTIWMAFYDPSATHVSFLTRNVYSELYKPIQPSCSTVMTN